MGAQKMEPDSEDDKLVDSSSNSSSNPTTEGAETSSDYFIEEEQPYHTLSLGAVIFCVMLLLLAFLGFLLANSTCVFWGASVPSYPVHASCNITWTFKERCDVISNKLTQQMEAWKTNSTCGTGQKCLYTFKSLDRNSLKATHKTPKAGYIDELEFKFYQNTQSGGCNVVGFSTSRIFFAVLDFGTNYCNLHNLVVGAGLRDDPNYSELTKDEQCTQYTSANCDLF